MSRAPDITWRECGLFVRFMAETPAGEEAWRTMAAKGDGTAAFLKAHRAAIVSQLTLAGYTVAKAKPFKPMKPGELDALLAELGS